MPEVSILIVAYQSAGVIGACLKAIPKACADHPYEVLLIDNGDGSTEAMVREQFPEVRIIASRGNIGFAAANNLLAREAQAPLLLLANPDLEMREGAVAALLAAAARYPEAGAWGGVTLASDGRPDIGNSVHIPSLSEMASRLLGRSSKRLDRADMLTDDHAVEALSGSFMMVPRRVWDEVAGMDERYFLYCEEVDLCLRLSRKGHALWRIGDARAFHDAGHGDALAPLRLLYKSAGTMEFARIHWSGARQLAAFMLIWLNAAARLVLGTLPGLPNARLRKMAKGYRGIVLAPRDWCFGYHPSKGLLARLGQKKGQAILAG